MTGASSASTLAAGRFQPNPLTSTVTIVSQTGEFLAATYLGMGFYEVVMAPIAGIPVVSGLSLGINAVVSPFGPAGTYRIAITNSAGNLVDDTFFLHVRLLP